jgi:hypothetical protein
MVAVDAVLDMLDDVAPVLVLPLLLLLPVRRGWCVGNIAS